MYRLSKKIEYALLAMQYIASNDNRKISAKEMSEKLNISFEFLSKTLQMLMKNGLVESHQGIRGGYTLAREPEDISVADVIHSLESKTGIVECMDDEKDDDNCGRADHCTIRTPIAHIQRKVNDVFKSTSIAELSEFMPDEQEQKYQIVELNER